MITGSAPGAAGLVQKGFCLKEPGGFQRSRSLIINIDSAGRVVKRPGEARDVVVTRPGAAGNNDKTRRRSSCNDNADSKRDSSSSKKVSSAQTSGRGAKAVSPGMPSSKTSPIISKTVVQSHSNNNNNNNSSSSNSKGSAASKTGASKTAHSSMIPKTDPPRRSASFAKDGNVKPRYTRTNSCASQEKVPSNPPQAHHSSNSKSRHVTGDISLICSGITTDNTGSCSRNSKDCGSGIIETGSTALSGISINAEGKQISLTNTDIPHGKKLEVNTGLLSTMENEGRITEGECMGIRTLNPHEDLLDHQSIKFYHSSPRKHEITDKQEEAPMTSDISNKQSVSPTETPKTLKSSQTLTTCSAQNDKPKTASSNLKDSKTPDSQLSVTNDENLKVNSVDTGQRAKNPQKVHTGSGKSQRKSGIPSPRSGRCDSETNKAHGRVDRQTVSSGKERDQSCDDSIFKTTSV